MKFLMKFIQSIPRGDENLKKVKSYTRWNLIFNSSVMAINERDCHKGDAKYTSAMLFCVYHIDETQYMRSAQAQDVLDDSMRCIGLVLDFEMGVHEKS